MKNRIDLLPRLVEALAVDNYLVVLLLFLTVTLFYFTLLKGLSAERHENVRAQLRSSAKYAVASLLVVIVVSYLGDERRLAWLQGALREGLPPEAKIESLLSFAGFIGLAICFMWVTKVIRLGTFVVSFFLSRRAPVPLVLINVITFLLAAGFGLIVANDVLGFSVAPLLATSAVLSLVLGLALQDTLGNLLTGIALQVDKPFRIGDWIELQGSGLKTVGQVTEINWRATVLQAFSDEVLVIPNRVVAQSQISNYSSRRLPVIRSHTFRFSYGTNLDIVRMALLECVGKVAGIHKLPAPNFIVLENGDSWTNCKLLYWIVDFGEQYTVGDKVLSLCHGRLQQMGIPLARPSFSIVQREAQPGTDF